MNAADEAYARLLEARVRRPSVEETEQRRVDDQRRDLSARIRRRLPSVY